MGLFHNMKGLLATMKGSLCARSIMSLADLRRICQLANLRCTA